MLQDPPSAAIVNLTQKMKAVKRFKNAIARRRPPGLDSILGKETRLVQPPMSMSISNSEKPPLFHKNRSMDNDDRRPIERALVAEGVHRDIDLNSYQGRIENRDDTTVAFAPEPPKRSSTNIYKGHESASPTHDKRDLEADPGAHRAISHAATFPHAMPHEGRGQAHDPLSDHLYLNLGPGGSSRPPSPPAVSESPPAAGTDIYETAYRREVERIRASQGRSATLFLTRRVEQMEDYMKDQDLIKSEDVSASKSMSGLSKVIAAARSKAEKDTATEDQKDERDKSNPNNAGEPDDSTSTEGSGTLPEKTKSSGLGSFSKLVDQAKSMSTKGTDSISGGTNE